MLWLFEQQNGASAGSSCSHWYSLKQNAEKVFSEWSQGKYRQRKSISLITGSVNLKSLWVGSSVTPLRKSCGNNYQELVTRWWSLNSERSWSIYFCLLNQIYAVHSKACWLPSFCLEDTAVHCHRNVSGETGLLSLPDLIKFSLEVDEHAMTADCRMTRTPLTFRFCGNFRYCCLKCYTRFHYVRTKCGTSWFAWKIWVCAALE